MKPIIEPVTASAVQLLEIGTNISLTISSGKLVSAETVTFQLVEEGVVTPGDLYQGGNIRQLTAINNALTIVGPIDLQVTKSVTAAAVGVYSKG
jgi:hypothetical protein